MVNNGHEVLVEAGAGAGAGFTDGEYASAGARIEDQPATIWASEMVIKVKEPLPSEYVYFREGVAESQDRDYTPIQDLLSK